jgi:hypothetical protein
MRGRPGQTMFSCDGELYHVSVWLKALSAALIELW